MTFEDFWMLDRFFVRHPHESLLVAAYLGYKAPAQSGKQSLREAAHTNSQALADPTMARAIPRGRMKSMKDLPAWTQTPEKMALIEKMKAAMRGETDG